MEISFVNDAAADLRQDLAPLPHPALGPNRAYMVGGMNPLPHPQK